jgi:hypothetical protein
MSGGAYSLGVSVCLPTWRRARDLPRRLDSLIKAIPDCPLELLVVCDLDDPETMMIPVPRTEARLPLRVSFRRLLVPPGSYPSVKWNVAAASARHAWLLMATDDVDWADDWWPGYDRLPAAGYLGLHDQLSRRCGTHTLWLARRDWLLRYAGGTLVCPLFRHIFIDVLMTLLAVRAGTNAVARGLIGTHVHSFDTSRADIALDESRKRAHTWRDDGKDHTVWEDLKLRNFPVGLLASPEWRPLW